MEERSCYTLKLRAGRGESKKEAPRETEKNKNKHKHKKKYCPRQVKKYFNIAIHITHTHTAIFNIAQVTILNIL